jgi:hypothetical protein
MSSAENRRPRGGTWLHRLLEKQERQRQVEAQRAQDGAAPKRQAKERAKEKAEEERQEKARHARAAMLKKV